MCSHSIYNSSASTLDLVAIPHAVSYESPIETALLRISKKTEGVEVVQQTMLAARREVDVPRVLGFAIISCYLPTRCLFFQRLRKANVALLAVILQRVPVRQAYVAELANDRGRRDGLPRCLPNSKL